MKRYYQTHLNDLLVLQNKATGLYVGWPVTYDRKTGSKQGDLDTIVPEIHEARVFRGGSACVRWYGRRMGVQSNGNYGVLDVRDEYNLIPVQITPKHTLYEQDT